MKKIVREVIDFTIIFEKLAETVVEKYLWPCLNHADVAALLLISRVVALTPMSKFIWGSNTLWMQLARFRFALEDAAVDAREVALRSEAAPHESPGFSGFDVHHHAVQEAMLSAANHPSQKSASFDAALTIYGDCRTMFQLRPRLRGDGVYAQFCRGVHEGVFLEYA